jgi:AraC-like DNA-binding protein
MESRLSDRMAKYSIREFPTAERSETAYWATDATLLPTQSGAFTTRVNRIEFERLWVRCVWESGPRLKQLVTRPDRSHFAFMLRPDDKMIIDGSELFENRLALYPREGRCFERSPGPTQWCGVSMPAKAMALASVALTGCEFAPAAMSRIINAELQSIEKLRELCIEAAALTERHSALLAVSEVGRRLEQALISALIRCLAEPPTKTTLPMQHARMIVERFHRMIELHPDRALYLPEVCAAIHVPERTLRQSCRILLDIPPARYLLLRRLHLAHRTLRAAKPGDTRVTEVAARFGFWHFGRFAIAYRSLFGEAPSETLKRA